MITKAVAIAPTTTPPATKLAKKFDNEAVISNPVFKIVRLTTIIIVSVFEKKNRINIYQNYI